jgi:GDPmannose 4,6-dehydratase
MIASGKMVASIRAIANLEKWRCTVARVLIGKRKSNGLKNGLIIYSNNNMETKKVALITGAGGQDCFYLAELLHKKGYEVHGLHRANSGESLEEAEKKFSVPLKLHFADMLNTSILDCIICELKPDEVYNLAAQSHVGTSFKIPEYTADVNALGVLRLLEAIKKHNPECRFYQASTSEMFGRVQETPQKETTPFHPRSPYGVAKLFGHWATINYRESYGMHASCGILFNHESPHRGTNFVTRKITKALAKIKNGTQEVLELGNMDAKRDWGHAKDYVNAMWLILQQDQPDDFVIATGETRTVREFAEVAAKWFEFDLEWQGSGVDEVGIDKKSNKVIIKINKDFYRPAEVDLLIGDPSKAKEKLGWVPEYDFATLVAEMCNEDNFQETGISLPF